MAKEKKRPPRRRLRITDFKKWGSEGGKKAQEGRTSKQRSDAARKAVQARWAAYRKEHPEPPKKGGKI